jgi:hypothetical protein
MLVGKLIEPAELEAVIVKEVYPGTVAVPKMSPVTLSSAIPVGSVPAVTAYVTFPPFALNVLAVKAMFFSW